MNSDQIIAVLREQVISGMSSDLGKTAEEREGANVTACFTGAESDLLAGRIWAVPHPAEASRGSTVKATASVTYQAKRWCIGQYLARAETEKLLLPGCLTSIGVRDVDQGSFSVLVTWQEPPRLRMEGARQALGALFD